MKVVLVTGCSSGFGRAIAQALHARGWRVMAGVREGAAPDGCETVRLDLGDAEGIAALGATIDKLDCLVNNAGYALTGPLTTYDAQQMRRQLEVNVLGPALLIQAMLPALARAKGRVINIGSMAGEIGLPLNAMYCASKGALHAMTDALRRELADHGVQVAAVVPGGFRTRFMSNMAWGSREAPAVETRQLARYRGFQQRIAARPGRPPDAVAHAVVRLAVCARMPARVYVGADAWLAHALLRTVPARWSEAMLTRALRRQLQP
jgi:NAD(P)-dependent dehydrogenase (short-subunit alcohol dehydrogenase family)